MHPQYIICSIRWYTTIPRVSTELTVASFLIKFGIMLAVRLVQWACVMQGTCPWLVPSFTLARGHVQHALVTTVQRVNAAPFAPASMPWVLTFLANAFLWVKRCLTIFAMHTFTRALTTKISSPRVWASAQMPPVVCTTLARGLRQC